MEIDSRGRTAALQWPRRKLTSMSDEGPGSVTHGAVLPVPALTGLGVVQEGKVHFYTRLPQLRHSLQKQ